MRAILGQRPLRFVFAANVISMLGSGMNSAAVAWYILQATHSEEPWARSPFCRPFPPC